MQVYKAVLRNSGKVAAVKVQRPGIESAIGMDFYLLRILTGVVDDRVAFLTTNVTALLDDFAVRVYEEVRHLAPATCPVLRLPPGTDPSRDRPAIDESWGHRFGVIGRGRITGVDMIGGDFGTGPARR